VYKILIILSILVGLLLPRVAFCLPNFPAADHRWSNLGLFFAKYHCPDINQTLIDDYISSADKYNIPYTLLPAISIIESQCGKHQRYSNWWGFWSATKGFDSVPEGIEYVTSQLAEGKYYKGLTTRQKLRRYCPNPTYPDRVLTLMQQIDETNISK
jgi:hypothetical protein